MDKYNFFRQGGPRPTGEQLLLTKAFYRNSNVIHARFVDWSTKDEFYFIPLYLEMTYSLGWVAEIAPDPVWFGSFVRCNLDHPELFQVRCPECGQPVFPHRYCGSPLSGRVDLEYECPCGRKGVEMVSGWRLRATVLRDQLSSDRLRYLKYRALHPGAKDATVEDLLKWLGL